MMAWDVDLEKELLGQPFSSRWSSQGDGMLVALHYAQMENALAVVSDLKRNVSFIAYGGFAERIGLGRKGTSETIASIWEKQVFSCVHPDDLQEKHLEELRFYHFVMSQPLSDRQNFYLFSHLRMKNERGEYVPVAHRMFYPAYDEHGCVRWALCLYNAALKDDFRSLIINSFSGESFAPVSYSCEQILSTREKEVLCMIDKGRTSKEIAADLLISVNTVNRHRQNILQKLQAANSVEACRIARGLNLI